MWTVGLSNNGLKSGHSKELLDERNIDLKNYQS